MLSRPDPLAEIPAAFAHITALTLSRRYRRGDVRAVEGTAGAHFVREVGSGAVTHLNATASVVLAACSDGTAADAVDALAERYPGVPRETLVDDTVAALRMLLERRLLIPALAPDGPRRADAPEPAAALEPPARGARSDLRHPPPAAHLAARAVLPLPLIVRPSSSRIEIATV